VLSFAAKELEFAVCSMSASPAGYGLRSARTIKAVKRLAREDAWGGAAGQDRDGVREGEDDEWGVIRILRCACLRAKESSCKQ
jgi:hypothetical protein